MLGIFVLIAIGVGAWWAFSPTRQFQNGFSRLIDNPEKHWGFERGALVTFVAGRYRQRPVMLQLFPPTGGEGYSYRPGEVVLTMEARAPDGAPWKNSALNRENAEVSRATFDLEGRYGLVLHPPAARSRPQAHSSHSATTCICPRVLRQRCSSNGAEKILPGGEFHEALSEVSRSVGAAKRRPRGSSAWGWGPRALKMLTERWNRSRLTAQPPYPIRPRSHTT